MADFEMDRTCSGLRLRLREVEEKGSRSLLHGTGLFNDPDDVTGVCLNASIQQFSGVAQRQ